MRDTTQVGHPDDDPQRDVPCVDCDREMARRALDTRGRCADCRTPGGLLVTALRARGVAAERLPKRDGVRVAGMHIDADEVGWHILHNEFDDGGRRTRLQIASEMRAQAADAVAAIVQAPALRAERDTLAARVAALAADPVILGIGNRVLVAQLREVEAHNARMAARLLMIADACDVMATPAATRHTLAEALPRAHADDWRDTAAAIRALAGGAA
jgi:hypothetical protein